MRPFRAELGSTPPAAASTIFFACVRETSSNSDAVSRTINNKDRVNKETRERVRRAIEKAGFLSNALARNFRRRRTNFIMVLPSIGDPFFAGIVKGIQSIAQQKGYNVLFSETSMNSAEFTNILVARQADGMILLATVPQSGVEVLSPERHRALPVVIACEAIQPVIGQEWKSVGDYVEICRSCPAPAGVILQSSGFAPMFRPISNVMSAPSRTFHAPLYEGFSPRRSPSTRRIEEIAPKFSISAISKGSWSTS